MSGFIRPITSIFMDGFQNALAQLIFLMSKIVTGNFVLVIKGQVHTVRLNDKTVITGAFQDIKCTFMHGFQNNVAY